jgi:hypothetical protein
MEVSKMVEFSQVDGKDIWETKDLFTALQTNKEEIMRCLDDYHITKVSALDTQSMEFEKWNFTNELVLVVMPLANITDTSGKKTRECLKNDGLKIKEKYYPMDFYTNEITKDSRYICYMRTRNLIICRVNIFADMDIFRVAWANFTGTINRGICKILTDEEKLSEVLKEQWFMNMDNRERDIKQEISGLNQNLTSYRQNLVQYSRELFVKNYELTSLMTIKKDFQSHIDRNIAELKAFPMIKSVEIKDRIYISFGPIYVTGRVKTGIEEVEGIKKPKMETKKVYIGELDFVIYGDRVKVINKDNEVDGHQHPHARNGDICFGDAGTEAYALISNIELGKLVKLLYSWALSYNEGDAYCKLQRFYEWELAKAKGVAKEDFESRDENYDGDDENGDGEDADLPDEAN